MQYTVCYAAYGAMIVDANSPEEAIEIITEECDISDNYDDFEVTSVIDETGHEIVY